MLVLAGLLSATVGSGATSAQSVGCWGATITEQWTNLELIGSVLRVRE